MGRTKNTFQRGKWWYGKYKDTNGEWHQIGGKFTTSKQAGDAAKAKEDELKNRNLDIENLTVEEFIQLFGKDYDGGLRKGTKMSHEIKIRKYLFPHIRRKMLNDITPIDVQRIFNSLKNTDLSISYKYEIQKFTKQFFNVAHQLGCIKRNPAFSFKLKKPSEKPRKKPDHKAIVSMIEYAEGDDRDLIACYYYGGMRKSESPGLKWKDIDLENHIINIRRQYCRGNISEPKADSSKTQYRVPKELIRILENRKKLSKQNQPDDWVFPSRDKSSKFHGKPIDIDGWYKNHYKPIRTKFGLDCTLTDLRKAYENVWKKFNQDLAIRRKQMRHSDIRTTMKYYDYVDDEDTIAAVEGFDTYIRSLKSEIRNIKRAK